MKLPRFFAISTISLIFIFTPLIANADEITITLDPETIYVDTIVEVTGPTEYFIETVTGVRLEQAPNGSVRIRDGWLDSWIELRQGDVILRADDDSNHVTGVNEYASKLTGTVDTGTYTIRATSYLNRVGAGTPTGTYTLSSNLIQPIPSPIVEPLPLPEPVPGPSPSENPVPTPVPEPVVPTPEPEPTNIAPLPEPPSPPPVVEPIIDTTVPANPDTEAVEPPTIIPPEPPLVEDTIAEEPPVPVEETPAPVEEPPAEAELPPPTVEETIADIIAEANGEAITADAMEEAGITYADLPPETPVEVRTDEHGNEVVITAEVAIALQLLESPAKLLGAIFTDPAQAISAIANIGADMSDEEREESEKIIVASVIAGQAAVNAATMAAGGTTRIPSAPSTPAGGPAAGNDKPKSTRRRKP